MGRVPAAAEAGSEMAPIAELVTQSVRLNEWL